MRKLWRLVLDNDKQKIEKNKICDFMKHEAEKYGTTTGIKVRQNSAYKAPDRILKKPFIAVTKPGGHPST